MRIASTLTAFLACVALLGVRPTAAWAQAAVADSDLTIAGVRTGSDTAELRRVLGAPLSRTPRSWSYRGLKFHLDGARVTRVDVTGRAFPTRRGLRVGDPDRRIAELYGDQSCMEEDYAYLVGGCDTPTARVGLGVVVKNGRVKIIMVGRIIEGG